MTNLPTRFSPEYQLLAAACLPPDSALAHAGVGPRLRWPRLLDLARHHRLQPLLLHHLVAFSLTDDIPDEARAQLEKSWSDTAAANLLRRVQLAELGAALAAEGVPAMLLKGAALVDCAYRNVRLRPMGDLDILVPEDDIDRAWEAVVALGYVPAETEAKQKSRREHHWHHPALVRPDRVSSVELHRHVAANCPQFRISDFFDRGGVGGRGGFLLPDTTDLFLHVGVHFAFDRLHGTTNALGQLADLAWLSLGPGVDWAALVARARAYGVDRRLWVALQPAVTLLGPIAPAWVVEDLAPAGWGRHLERRLVDQRVLGRGPWLHGPTGGAGQGPRPSLGQLLPGREYLVRRYGTVGPPGAGLGRLYLRRARAGLRVVLPWAARPWNMISDLRLDRRMRSLEMSHRPPPTAGSGQPPSPRS